MTSFENFGYKRVFEIVFDRESSRLFTKWLLTRSGRFESRVDWLRLLSSEYANSTGLVIRKL